MSENFLQPEIVILLYSGTREMYRNKPLNDSDHRRFVSRTGFYCQYCCVSLCA